MSDPDSKKRRYTEEEFALILRKASEMQISAGGQGGGGAGKYHLDCVIPGRLPPEEMGRILEQVRRAAEHQGEASEVLGGVEWETVGDLSAINVNISPRGDETSIQIVGDRSAAGAVTFIFPMGAAAILVGALGAAFEPTSAAGIISLITGTLGGAFLMARTAWVSGSNRFRTRLTHLMDTVSSSVERVALPAGPDEE